MTVFDLQETYRLTSPTSFSRKSSSTIWAPCSTSMRCSIRTPWWPRLIRCQPQRVQIGRTLPTPRFQRFPTSNSCPVRSLKQMTPMKICFKTMRLLLPERFQFNSIITIIRQNRLEFFIYKNDLLFKHIFGWSEIRAVFLKTNLFSLNLCYYTLNNLLDLTHCCHLIYTFAYPDLTETTNIYTHTHTVRTPKSLQDFCFLSNISYTSVNHTINKSITIVAYKPVTISNHIRSVNLILSLDLTIRLRLNCLFQIVCQVICIWAKIQPIY